MNDRCDYSIDLFIQYTHCLTGLAYMTKYDHILYPTSALSDSIDYSID